MLFRAHSVIQSKAIIKWASFFVEISLRLIAAQEVNGIFLFALSKPKRVRPFWAMPQLFRSRHLARDGKEPRTLVVSRFAIQTSSNKSAISSAREKWSHRNLSFCEMLTLLARNCFSRWTADSRACPLSAQSPKKTSQSSYFFEVERTGKAASSRQTFVGCRSVPQTCSQMISFAVFALLKGFRGRKRPLWMTERQHTRPTASSRASQWRMCASPLYSRSQRRMPSPKWFYWQRKLESQSLLML